MFRPGRLLLVATVAALVYFGFFAVPGGNPSVAAFDPETVAHQELAVWQAAAAREEMSVFPSVVVLLREQQRMSWFRAVQSSYYLSRATLQFVDMRNRFERVLPDLVESATVEKTWRKADFDPAKAARTQLTWWVTSKQRDLSSTEAIAALMAQEYAIRYGVEPGDVAAAVRLRAEAARMRDQTSGVPDWDTIRQLLVESYKELRVALERAEARPKRAA